MKQTIVIACTGIALLSACQSAVVTGLTETTHAVAERRSIGQVMDDAAIYTEINHYFLQTDINDLLPNVNVVVRAGRVLLIGTVKSQQTIDRAVEIAWRVRGVKEVINELTVNPDGTSYFGARDEWIEKQVEAKLTMSKGVDILNYSVEVENGKVYLLGVVASQAELNNVFAVARRVRGVKEVVSHLRMAEPDEVQHRNDDPTHHYPDTPYRH